MMKSTALILLFLLSSENVSAQSGPPAVKLQHEAAALTEEWKETKKDYKNKLEELIQKVVAAIEENENSLDHGDRKLRGQIHEERKDLERTRDRLKRMLAELSGANTIDRTKIKENLHAKIEDMKD